MNRGPGGWRRGTKNGRSAIDAAQVPLAACCQCRNVTTRIALPVRPILLLEWDGMANAWQDRIESDPRILRGKPCVRGTRIPVALVLGYLAAGKTAEQVIEQFPDLAPADITAALGYARDLADFEAVALP